MHGGNALNNTLKRPSFWQFQIIGWISFWLTDILGSIPGLMSGKDTLRQENVPVIGMLLGSFALHPVCRRLLRQSNSWLAFELKAAGSSVVQLVFQHQAMAAIDGGKAATAPR
jgi:hypothetical protein